MAYMGRSLAFDWLYGFAGFDAALKDRVAGELVEGAQRMMALQSLANPDQASYHNHTVRELALAVFALAAVEGHPSVEARAAPLREKAARALDNILETTDLVNPEGGYHESMDYMRITWAPLALDGRAAPHDDGRRSARRFGVFRSMGRTPLQGPSRTARPRATTTTSSRTSTRWTACVLGYAVHRFKDPFAAWFLAEERLAARPLAHPRAQFLWRDDTVVPRIPRPPPPPRSCHGRSVSRHRSRDPARRMGADATWIEFSCGLLREARPSRYEPVPDLPPGTWPWTRARTTRRRRAHTT
jgi:hypothetical protein